jgi:uncharacterized protein YcbX
VEKFGEEETEEYVRLAKATRALIFIWEEYANAPEGSPVERLMADHFEQMLVRMRTSPEHAVAMVESLVALVLHMKMGGTYEEWFTSLGIKARPRP